MTSPTIPSDVWQRLYVSPPPDVVACGDDAYLFTFDAAGESGGLMNRKSSPQTPRAAYAAQISAALELCAVCPLSTRAWCLDAVRAQHSGVSIIAGGVVFSHGTRVWSLEDERRQEVAA
jgi:hypothetical protein